MSKLGDLWRKITTPKNDPPARDPWDSAEGTEILKGMHYSNSALAAEVERGRVRRAGQVDDFPSLVHDVIIQVMAQECAALPDVSAMADQNGNPLPGFARMARADYERRGGSRAVTPDGVAKALVVLVEDIREGDVPWPHDPDRFAPRRG